MEKQLNCYANFDFDLRLADPSFQKKIEPQSRFNQPLQYLFLWTAKENEALYAKELPHYDFYFEKIKKLRGFCPKLTEQSDDISFWWGKCHDEASWQKEKVINSKQTSSHVEKKLKINVAAASRGDRDLIVKNEHGFSGLGHQKTNDLEHTHAVVERKLERLADYSSMISKDEIIIYRNFIDDHFQYRGSYLSGAMNDIFSVDEYQKNLKEIFSYYQSHYQVDQLQVDSFIYQEEGKHKWRYLCEVNHRKSMGLMAHLLHKQFGSYYSLYILLPKSCFEQNNYLEGHYDHKDEKGMIQLSHPDEVFQSYFLSHESKGQLQELIEKFSKLACLKLKHHCYNL